MYKNLQKRRKYIKEWRARRVLKGCYGKCKNCKQNLGRNEVKITKKTNICKKCLKGKLHPSWKGGYLNADGYRVINLSNKKTMLEHRYVMQKYLERPLFDNETVHHKNGMRDDNRIENLELWVGAPVRGLKIKDALDWAKEIIKRYE